MNHNLQHLSKYTSIYRCLGDITNLNIRVKLKEAQHIRDNSHEWQERAFNWQQKVFSKSEIEFYKEEKNCVSELEKKYHLDVLELESDGALDVFSYIHQDEFNKNENNENFFCKKCDSGVMESYDFGKSLQRSMESPMDSAAEFEMMVIMVDLGDYVDATWIKNERILFMLKYDKIAQVLVAYPDFTKAGYYESDVDDYKSRKVLYSLENTSPSVPELSRRKEKELIQKINRHISSVNQTSIPEFSIPLKNQLEIYLFCEILWASNFEYETIYIQYFIDLPKNWKCENEEQLQGITQTSCGKLAHFGHVFDLKLTYNLENFGAEIVPESPCLYLEVISVDNWNRSRTEGLAYKSLSIGQPGVFKFDLQCFRLGSVDFVSEMRRFFVGDCSNYKDIRWIGSKQKTEKLVDNKYGTQTVGTGVIGFNMNVVHQSYAFMKNNESTDNNNREVFHTLNTSKLVKSVDKVLQAFKQARNSMLEARKNL